MKLLGESFILNHFAVKCEEQKIRGYLDRTFWHRSFQKWYIQCMIAGFPEDPSSFPSLSSNITLPKSNGWTHKNDGLEKDFCCRCPSEFRESIQIVRQKSLIHYRN